MFIPQAARESTLGRVCSSTSYGGNTTSHALPLPITAKHYIPCDQVQGGPQRTGYAGGLSQKKRTRTGLLSEARGRLASGARAQARVGSTVPSGFQAPSGSHPPLSTAQDAHSAQAGKDGLLHWAVGTRIQLAWVRKGMAGSCDPTATNLRGECQQTAARLRRATGRSTY